MAVPVIVKQRFRGTTVRVEVRRARGRAVSVLPRDGELPFLDDGVGGVDDPQTIVVDRARSLGGVRGLTRCASLETDTGD